MNKNLLSTSFLLLLVACASSPLPNMNMTFSDASKAAQRIWGFCVFQTAEELANGSDDVRLVVDTALSACKKHKIEWWQSLAKDNLNSAFLDSYYQTSQQGIKEKAWELVLRKKAAHY